MSSSELETIYNNAAGIILLRLKGAEGAGTVLDAIRGRVLADNHNPLENRSLIIEPAMLAQRLRVPRRSVDAVIEELRRFNFVHVWARAVCPVMDSDDDNVIVETNDSKAFKEALREACPHCGQYHESLSWSDIETFFAVNVDERPDSFDIRRFFISRKRLMAPVSASSEPVARLSLWERIKNCFFVSGHGCPSEKRRSMRPLNCSN